jgi:hypothetical protein
MNTISHLLTYAVHLPAIVTGPPTKIIRGGRHEFGADTISKKIIEIRFPIPERYSTILRYSICM